MTSCDAIASDMKLSIWCTSQTMSVIHYVVSVFAPVCRYYLLLGTSFTTTPPLGLSEAVSMSSHGILVS